MLLLLLMVASERKRDPVSLTFRDLLRFPPRLRGAIGSWFFSVLSSCLRGGFVFCSDYLRLAGGTMPFIRRYSTSWP
jgi:hypothetical protein